MKCQSEDENEIEESSKDEKSDPESENFCLEDKLLSLWGSLSPPTKEENLIQKCGGCICKNFSKPKQSKSQTLYICKVLCRFLSDENVRHIQ